MRTGLETGRKLRIRRQFPLRGDILGRKRAPHRLPRRGLVRLRHAAEQTVAAGCELRGRVGEVLGPQGLEGPVVDARYCLRGRRYVFASRGVAVAAEAGGGGHDGRGEERVVVESPVPVAGGALVWGERGMRGCGEACVPGPS